MAWAGLRKCHAVDRVLGESEARVEDDNCSSVAGWCRKRRATPNGCSMSRGGRVVRGRQVRQRCGLSGRGEVGGEGASTCLLGREGVAACGLPCWMSITLYPIAPTLMRLNQGRD
jgi:hypothetical protein